MRAAEVGYAVVPIPEFEPETVIETVKRTGATAISLVPTMLSRMMEAGWREPATIRFVLLGGGPCPETVLHEAIDRRIPIALTYGLTEACSQVGTLPPWDSLGRLRTSGRALPGVRIRIADSPDRPLKPGTPGQIWVTGATVAKQTLDGPLPTQSGWYATGDLGTLDGDNFLTVLGRLDDLILTGGEKVVPQEVEAALLAHPDVAEACVFGVPDDEWGQRAVAAVTLKPGAGRVDPADLRAGLKKELMYHKVPRQIVIVGQMPLTGPGKVDRSALRSMLRQAGIDIEEEPA
jgi:O-succinylbenzoic acid--CoA ligase